VQSFHSRKRGMNESRACRVVGPERVIAPGRLLTGSAKFGSIPAKLLRMLNKPITTCPQTFRLRSQWIRRGYMRPVKRPITIISLLLPMSLAVALASTGARRAVEEQSCGQNPAECQAASECYESANQCCYSQNDCYERWTCICTASGNGWVCGWREGCIP
jgi:hypothetical protein